MLTVNGTEITEVYLWVTSECVQDTNRKQKTRRHTVESDSESYTVSSFQLRKLLLNYDWFLFPFSLYISKFPVFSTAQLKLHVSHRLKLHDDIKRSDLQ